MLIVYLCTQKYIENEIHKVLFAIPQHNKQVQKLNIFITLFKRILLVKQQRFIKELFIHVLPSIFSIDSCNHKGLALHCTSGACSSFLGFAFQGNIFIQTIHVNISKCFCLHLNSFFPFLFSLVVIISFHFMCFITE